MKVVHICLSGMFTDGFSYQENLLTKYHVKAGHEVTMITSQWIYNSGTDIIKYLNTDYFNEDHVKIIRLPIQRDKNISYRLKRYIGVVEALSIEKPDILFIHGCQFLDILKIKKYLKNNKIQTYVDNHADFTNSATNFLSKYILHGIVWRYCAQNVVPYVERFYGVLPSRVDFLVDMYGIPREKCELLVMGADDELVEKAGTEERCKQIRARYNISESDFLVMSGGKIDRWKTQTLFLMEAVKKIEHSDIKLIIFGSVADELKEKVTELTDGVKIQYIGWIQAKDSYDLFAAADLVVFPGRHSVFWEQVVAQGIPMIVKEWPGTHHVDLGGNVQFLKEDSVEEIRGKIERLMSEPDEYGKMKRVAVEEGMREFSYREIAKRSIEL